MDFKRIIRGLKQPHKLFKYIVYKTAKIWSDETFLKMLFPLCVGYKLNLDNPKTFNEKLQWLKLHNRKPIYTKMVDKVDAKEYVANIIGEEYIIPTLGVFDNVDDIDFEALPNQFVLKCTHDSGGIVVCDDKSQLNIEEAKRKLRRGLKMNYYHQNREWPYLNVKPRIIAEQYMVDESGYELKDYKIHCFNGTPEVILVCKDRYAKTGITEDFFSVTWEHLKVKRPLIPNSIVEIPKPQNLDLMLSLSKKLSADIPFLRVDFYEIKSQVYFGELTFYPASGMGEFVPIEWDYKLGEMIKLPIE